MTNYFKAVMTLPLSDRKAKKNTIADCSMVRWMMTSSRTKGRVTARSQMGNDMERTYTIEYTVENEVLGQCTVKQKMSQVELGKLLLQPGVALVSVDRQNNFGYNRKPSKKRLAKSK